MYGLGVHYNVIRIYETSLILYTKKDIIHNSLESRLGIFAAKGYF